MLPPCAVCLHHDAEEFFLDCPNQPNSPCPAGLDQCPVAEEVRRLREECRRLSELSQTDPLTGLFNFQHLVEALEKEMERTRRTKLPTALIMIDLDRFKSINDTHGHPSGNEALLWVSNIWRGTTRKIDVTCRYGGEEFTIILPGTSLQQAVRTAERLRATVADSPLELNGQTVHLTASFGVDVYRASDRLCVSDFLERADRHLRRAKQEGRNRVCFEDAKPEKVPTEVTVEERAALFITRWPKT